MKIWMYYETDGDSGDYNIKLFTNEKAAKAYQKDRDSAYGKVEYRLVYENS